MGFSEMANANLLSKRSDTLYCNNIERQLEGRVRYLNEAVIKLLKWSKPKKWQPNFRSGGIFSSAPEILPLSSYSSNFLISANSASEIFLKKTVFSRAFTISSDAGMVSGQLSRSLAAVNAERSKKRLSLEVDSIFFDSRLDNLSLNVWRSSSFLAPFCLKI